MMPRTEISTTTSTKEQKNIPPADNAKNKTNVAEVVNPNVRTAYETTKLARHSNRPNCSELIQMICSDFVELRGDRAFSDDPAIVSGIASFEQNSVVIIGHQKGRTTAENIKRNFGMPQPEGYRKSLRMVELAERFHMPLITLIDTPGAYPGLEAEERSQAEAIGKIILQMSQLRVPSIAVVIGEGGSGGALALGVANFVHMFEHSIYSVISPEGCASILLRDASKASLMAESLKLTAPSALALGVIDSILEEPDGGAHLDHKKTAQTLKRTLIDDLTKLKQMSPSQIAQHRYDKYRAMGIN